MLLCQSQSLFHILLANLLENHQEGNESHTILMELLLRILIQELTLIVLQLVITLGVLVLPALCLILYLQNDITFIDILNLTICHFFSDALFEKELLSHICCLILLISEYGSVEVCILKFCLLRLKDGFNLFEIVLILCHDLLSKFSCFEICHLQYECIVLFCDLCLDGFFRQECVWMLVHVCFNIYRVEAVDVYSLELVDLFLAHVGKPVC